MSGYTFLKKYDLYNERKVIFVNGIYFKKCKLKLSDPFVICP